MFSMSDLGLLSYYLGIEVKQTSEGIFLGQARYASKILKKCGMEKCNPAATPLEHKLKLSKESKSPSVNATDYRSVVGSLRYLIHTRPDICYAVGVVSRFMENPTEEHLLAVKHILRYVRGSPTLGCFYRREGTERVRLIGYSDSDLAGDIDDRKSTTGMIFYLGSSPITWSSQKQKTVALSSCQAEYIAAAAAACQGIWLVRLLDDLFGEADIKIQLKVDNQSAISLSKNPVYHDRSKHIETRYHFIRECVENGQVVVEHVRTEDQMADILTKALGRVKFLEMRGRIGMTAIS